MTNRRERRRSRRADATVNDAGGVLEQAIAHHNAGRLRQAEAGYRRILSTEPKHPVALQLLGVIAHQSGNHQAAIELIGRAIALQPTYAEAHNNLGNILRQSGRIEEALASFRRAATHAPAYPQAHNNVGLALQDLGRLDQAIDSFRKAVAMAPQYAEAWNNLGNALDAAGKGEEAAAAYQKAIGLRPDIPEIHYNSANALRRLQRLEDAAEGYREAIRIRPGYAEAHAGLAATLRRLGRFQEAAQSYRTAIAGGLDNPAMRNSLGLALRELDRSQEAIAQFREAIARDPDDAGTHNNLGLALQEAGELDAAANSFRKAVELDPGFGIAYLNLATLTDNAYNEEAIERMERLADDPGTPEKDQAPLMFALGKACEDIGDYDRAFEWFARANLLKRRQIAFNADALAEEFARIRAIFDEALFRRLQGAGSASDVPIFVVGMPRAGTTLVEQILASHPQVHGAGELRHLNRLTAGLPQRIGTGTPFPECVADADPGIWRKLADDYVASLRTHDAHARHITDKMPNNFLRIGLIHLMLPNARIVHCRRSPLDTCLSCFTLQFSEGQAFSYDLADLGHFYRQYESLMQHWQEVLPGRVLEVHYEDVVNDLAGQARRLTDHCGLPWDERCLAFHESKRTVRTASLAQVRKPIYDSSQKRWRRYETHLRALIEALGPFADVG